MKPFIDLGTRNKGTFWEYCSAYSFLHTQLPVTEYTVPLFLGVGKGNPNKHCHHIDVINNTKNLMIKEFKEGKYTKEFFEKLDDVYSVPLEEIKEFCKKDILNNKELVDIFDKISKCMFETHKPMLLALKAQYLKEFFEQELRKVLSEEEKIAEFTSLLLTPTKPTFVQEEQEKLLEVLNLFENSTKEEFFGRKDIKEKLSNLAKECGWFHMEYMWNPWNEEDYKEYLWSLIQENSSIRSPKQRIEEIKAKQEEFFKTHQNSDTLEELTFVLQEFSMILDVSKAVLIEGSYISRPLFTKIAEKLGLTWQELLYLTLPEIKELLEKNEPADKNLIEERKKNRAVLLKDGKISIYQGEEAAKLGKELIQEEEIENIKEFKGIVGYQGKVKGKVTVIHSINDKNKFTKGDILVTHDGTAELTLFLKQAGAIVTDQGGMICHAAILARELKTPCIVGTNIATKVLRDGDLVEIDADNGVAKIIKRK
jgi:phosphohistidine swiveling domain-containing protein